MPAQRTKHDKVNQVSQVQADVKVPVNSMNSKYFDTQTPTVEETNDTILVVQGIYYPSTSQERDTYRTKAGKQLTAHQWAVYDFARSIPRGKVMTYKAVASAAGGSPRSVGSALRNNPFNPYVPCHRVIASNLFIGGFFGEWGKDHKTGTRYNEKITILLQEGVHFDDSGHLLNPDKVLWNPSSCAL